MSITLICPECLIPWKIISDPDTRDEHVVCPNCKPGGNK